MKTKRVLVIKHGALGDMVQGLDAFAGLRAGLPDAYLALLTTPPFLDLAGRMTWFDEVICDRRAPAVNLAELWRMRGVFRAGWDAVVDLQCSRRTAQYHRRFTPAATRWFGTAAGASDPYPDFAGVNNAERMRIGIEMAGGDRSVTAGLDWLDDADGKMAGDLAGATILVPGCSAAKPGKRWPAAKYAAVAEMEMTSGRKVAVVGTSADRAVADAVIGAAPGCVDLVGRTGLGELAALFRQAGAVVGNDTGPTFLAARVGAPTLMLMGADTDPSMSAPVGVRAGWLRETAISDIAADRAMAGLERLRKG
ncbi:MAG: glycosyltransferase family 9 protein [Pseudomonadota bacterium]|nr:glycosyltransferase family 9 protein [Pseudomonadota bacterium]